MRLMALDVGDKRIGVAVSDKLGKTARPHTVIDCQGLDQDIQSISTMIEDLEVGKIVVGLPLSLDGTHGLQAKKVESLIDILKKKLNIPVESWDERLSTKSAERILREAGVKAKKRRLIKDKLAAALILQAYLDRSCYS